MFRSFGWFGIGSIVMALAFIEGNRHWGDSVPLENTIEVICKKISRKYKP